MACDGLGRFNHWLKAAVSGPEVPPFQEILTHHSVGLVDYGASIDSFLLEVAALTGDNNVVNSEFEVELDYEEALVLSAFIDLHRLAVLRSCADEEDYAFPPLSADAIITQVQATGSSPQALTGIIRSVKGRPEDPSPDQAAACLEFLVQRGVLSEDEGGYLPGDDLERLAGNLLIFQV